jgi:phytoene dehydrogenase-like protein
MNKHGRKIVIVGGGIAGLCAAVYALKCGYDVEVLEMHDMAGGLAMSWRRGAYTFETCLHWLIGSKPGADFNAHWQEVCDIHKLTFINPEQFVRIETEGGDNLTIFTNIDRLEVELLRRAPQDGPAIRDLVHSMRVLAKFRMLDPAAGFSGNWLNMLRDLPVFPVLMRLSKISGREFSKHFADPLLQSFFSNGDVGRIPALAMVLSLAWMDSGNAGYCIGGAQALIRQIEDKIASLGGKIRFRAKGARILVENNHAVGVELANGETILADWVISAADGHATLFDLLDGKYVDNPTRKMYDEKPLFASYMQISLGVALDLHDQPPMLSRILSTPVTVDPETDHYNVGFRIFNFDPTFAPTGKTAVTCLLSTRNFKYWSELRANNLAEYHREKNRVAEAVIEVLERRIPGARAAIETVDVSTPASVFRYTGNWQGTMEGWLPEPGSGFRPLPNTLPGLERFMMVGQWVMPGGGLPSGPMTAKPAIKAICKLDHIRFDLHPEPAHDQEPVAV